MIQVHLKDLSLSGLSLLNYKQRGLAVFPFALSLIYTKA